MSNSFDLYLFREKANRVNNLKNCHQENVEWNSKIGTMPIILEQQAGNGLIFDDEEFEFTMD